MSSNSRHFESLEEILDVQKTGAFLEGESCQTPVGSPERAGSGAGNPSEASQDTFEGGSQEKEGKHVYEETIDSLAGDGAGSGRMAKIPEDDGSLLKEMEKFEREITRRATRSGGLLEKISHGVKNFFDEANGNYANTLSDYELITEHQKAVKKIIGSFEKSKARISGNYEILEKERLKSAKDLSENIRQYLVLEKELERIKRNATLLEERASKTNASDGSYAEILRDLGSLKLERQKKSNQYEKTAHGIMNSKMALEEISDYQLAVTESMQTIDDAILHLERVNMQSFVSGTASSSLSQGEINLGTANEVVESLSKVVSHSYVSINASLNRLSSRNSNLEEKAGDTDYVSDRSLYVEINDLRKDLNQDAHKYVRKMFEENIIE